jgi:hypothetical protein
VSEADVGDNVRNEDEATASLFAAISGSGIAAMAAAAASAKVRASTDSKMNEDMHDAMKGAASAHGEAEEFVDGHDSHEETELIDPSSARQNYDSS